MTDTSSYQEALDYIYSFVDYSLTKNLRYSPEKFNLSRMNRFLELIGNPHHDYKIIHVAGTKGKGSICAMLASILTQSGYRTGFYSSPHMVDFTERIRIDDQLISQDELAANVDYLKSYIDQVEELTTFEITTGLAFKYFSDQKVDFAVVEVGLGGRFDATNIVTPLVSVISNISFDHMKILGNTLSKIAFEKAGIIKNGVPVVVSPQKNTAVKMIESIAEKRDAPLIYTKLSYKMISGKKSLDFQEFGVEHNSSSSGMIRLPLIGPHQLENARTAYAVIDVLREKNVKVPENAVRSGFENVNWPGRFEILQREPLVIIDGAHNPESFRNLAKTIQEYLPEMKVILVFGISEDKNLATMLRIIQPVVDDLIITQSTHPRALEASRIQKIAKTLGISAICYERVEDAKEKAESLSNKKSVIIAAGSLFIAGAFREMYIKNV